MTSKGIDPLVIIEGRNDPYPAPGVGVLTKILSVQGISSLVFRGGVCTPGQIRYGETFLGRDWGTFFTEMSNSLNQDLNADHQIQDRQ